MEWVEFSVTDEIVVPAPMDLVWTYLVDPLLMPKTALDVVLACTASGTPGRAEHTYFVEQLNHDGESFCFKVRVLKGVAPEVYVTHIEQTGYSNTDHIALSLAGGGRFTQMSLHSLFRIRVAETSKRAVREVAAQQRQHMQEHTRAHLEHFSASVAGLAVRE